MSDRFHPFDRRHLNQWGARPLRRRALLTAGVGAVLGSQMSAGLGVESVSSTEPGFGTAKRCIVLFMWGGPSQLDTFDPKPNAPQEVRGEFSPIETATPGMQICEHFRRVARLTDHIALIRSVSHDDPAHLSSAHTTLTGHLPPVNKSDAEPPSRNDHPYFGSVLSRFRNSTSGMPSAVMMPWKTLHPAAPGGESPGQTGGWLGHTADPMLITGDPNTPGWQVPSLTLLDGVNTNRLGSRKHLLESIERQQWSAHLSATTGIESQQRQAFELLGSASVRRAFDLNAEHPSTRDRYGRHIHGQCVLLGRRLLESGVPFVGVNWHNDGRNFWDTHGDNFNRLKNDLIPPADMALSALLQDLIDRNMLHDTLVVWTGEFGRRPQINPANAGREHHPFCYSALMAGGGVRGGLIHGKSDAIAMHPEDSAVSPRDLVATMLHATGVPRDTTLNDLTGRPHPLYAGQPIHELFQG